MCQLVPEYLAEAQQCGFSANSPKFFLGGPETSYWLRSYGPSIDLRYEFNTERWVLY